MSLTNYIKSPAAKRVAFALMIGVGLAFVVLPMTSMGSKSMLFTLTLMFTNVAVAINWNITGGFTGYVDFGHAVWFGIGAYVTAMLMAVQVKLDAVTLEETVEPDGLGTAWGPVPSILIATLVTGLCAALIGRATMRLKGPYFSIAMLGTFVAVRELVRVAEPITGGGVGLNLEPYLNRPLFYYIHLGIVFLLALFTWWLRQTRFGTNLLAIREDEVGAEMRGINTTMTKAVAFAFSGLSTGLLGGLWAYQFSAVDPDIAFAEVRTIEAVLGTMLGGLGSVIGPIIGATSLYWLKEVLWAHFLDLHLMFQGVLLIFIVMYIPKGLAGIFDSQTASLVTLWSRWFPAKKPSDDVSASEGLEISASRSSEGAV